MNAPGKLMRTPRSVDIEITNKCNLRCLYCGHFSTSADVAGDLPPEEWIRFFEELNRDTVLEVTLSGGEPFCRSDLREIIDAVVANRMRYSLLTNGTLVTEERAAYLASTRRCKHVQVSLDGPTAQVHDSCRGQGNFDRAVNGIKLLKKHGLPVSVRVTIHNSNVDHLEEIAHLLLDELGLAAFSTNSASYMGLCQQHPAIQLGVKERMIAMASLVALSERYPGRILANAGPLADARHWAAMEQARNDGVKAMSDRGYLTACNCPKRSIAVRADGIIVPCNLLSQIELGRINRDNLLDIWQHHHELVKLRERSRVSLSSFDQCRDCSYLPYCTGGCPALAYSLLGNINHPSPDACYRQFLADGGKLPGNTLSAFKQSE